MLESAAVRLPVDLSGNAAAEERKNLRHPATNSHQASSTRRHPTCIAESPANCARRFVSQATARVACPTRFMSSGQPLERLYERQTYLRQQVGGRRFLGIVQIFLEYRRIGGFAARLHEPRSI